MNSFEINKILGAVLGTCLVLLIIHIAAGALASARRIGCETWSMTSMGTVHWAIAAISATPLRRKACHL